MEPRSHEGHEGTRREEEKMKITNYKSQITNKFQIRNYKLQTLLCKRNTDDYNGARC